MANFKEKVCKLSGVVWKQYNSLQKCQCEQCKAVQKNPIAKQKKVYTIPKQSEKRKALNPIYEKVRIEVLTEANFVCFIDGCKRTATTAEHTMGRKGFADQWARDNNIPLLVDKRFLKPCCWQHNGELENNPELSKEYQLSKIHGGKKL